MAESDPDNQPAARAPARRAAVFVLKLLIAGGLLAWLVLSGRLDLSPLRSLPHSASLLPAAAMLLISMLLPVWRWMALLRVQQLRIGHITALRLTWLGRFANLFLPGAAGGDLAKAYEVCRHQPKAKTRAVSTVLMDRAFGLHSLLFIGSVAGVFILASGSGTRQASVIWFAVSCLAVSTAGLILLLWRPSSGSMLRLVPGRFRAALADSLELYRRNWKKLLGIWAYSGLCNAPVAVAYVLVAIAVGANAMVSTVLAVPLIVVANSLPISPGGLGVGEAVGSQLFAEFGLPNGALIVLIMRLGVACFSVPGALTLLGRGKAKLREPA